MRQFHSVSLEDLIDRYGNPMPVAARLIDLYKRRVVAAEKQADALAAIAAAMAPVRVMSDETDSGDPASGCTVNYYNLDPQERTSP